MMPQIFSRFKNILVQEWRLDPGQVQLTSRLAGDLGIDSLQLVELIVLAEKEFDIEIDDLEASRLSSVGDMVEYISLKMAGVSQ